MHIGFTHRQASWEDFRKKHVSIRPPWALPEDDFQIACTNCGECVNHCPEHILVIDSENYPEVDFRLGECTFCGDCVSHCHTNALLRYVGHTTRNPWSVKANISSACLASTRTTCLTCVEICQQEALTFAFGSTGTSRPNLDLDLCNGCGACYAQCPANAINMQAI